MDIFYVAILFILIIFSPIILPLIYCFIKHYNYIKIRDKQHLMFCQMKKGDYVWRSFEGEVVNLEIKKINYHFIGKRLSSITFITNKRIDIDFSPFKFKSYKFGNYFALYSEAKACAEAYNFEREKQINSLKNVSGKELNGEIEKLIERLKTYKLNTNDTD